MSVGVLCVDVVKKLLAVFCILNDKGIIHKPEPQVGVRDSAKGFNLNLLYEQVGN